MVSGSACLSHALVHTDMPHLVVNMFVLYMFGRNVELLYGMVLGQVSGAVFLLLYLGGAVISSVPAFVKHGDTPGYRAVGASGAVSRGAIRADPLDADQTCAFPIHSL